MYLIDITQPLAFCVFFFFNDTATTEIYTLSLHDALPICPLSPARRSPQTAHNHAHLAPERGPGDRHDRPRDVRHPLVDRKSTRLNSSHSQISYAVFCLKKKRINSTPCSAHHVTHASTGLR